MRCLTNLLDALENSLLERLTINHPYRNHANNSFAQKHQLGHVVRRCFTGKGTLTIKPNQEGGAQDNFTNDRGSGVVTGAGRVGDP